MPTDCISYQKSGYFSKLIVDYLDQKPLLNELYNHFASIENFKTQIEEKSKNFNSNDNFNRQILVSEIEKQYTNFEVSEATLNNIKLLNDSKTFTITTGHQLNLFTGPLYFLYKIISTINLCKELKAKYPKNNFVPVYWMATEDHDFDEINYFTFKEKKFRWGKKVSGAVGRLSTEGLDSIFDVFVKELGESKNADYLKNLFQKAYLEHKNLADATRFLTNELFGQYGLVILDGDNANLKSQFIPYIKDELLNQTSFKKITQTNELLKDYTIQVNPRKINLFYLDENLRERIVFEDTIYKVNNTNLTFTETEILDLVDKNPEKFSPNVVLRPLYQEVILPNLCYIGGGGEIAYWLQLKSNFESNKVMFPMLLVRNSVILANEKQNKKADKLNLSWADLFTNQNDLVTLKTKELSQFTIDFTEQKEFLKKQFENLYIIANQTEKSFFGAVKAQETKQIKGLKTLEKRLLKAEKKAHSEYLSRIIELQNELFPNQSLQERQTNFSEYYLENGKNLILKLIKVLNPLEQNFEIIEL